MLKNSRHLIIAAHVAVALCGSLPTTSRAQGLDLPASLDDPFGVGGDLGKVMEGMLAPEDDLNLLKFAHYSELHRWAGVEPATPEKDVSYTGCAWKAGAPQTTPPRTLCRPLRAGEACTMVNIPETREYRLWLGYLAAPGKAAPVTLRLAGQNNATHVFGQKPLPAGKRGAEIEKLLPVRFEDDLSRLSQPSKPLVIWEYLDIRLTAGATRLALSSEARDAQVDGILISGSRSAFAPAKSMVEGQGNLYNVWCRVRVAKAAGNAATYNISGSSLGYHWRRIPRGMTEPLWYSRLGTGDKQGFVGEKGESAIAVGAWTRWVDITQDVSDGRWAHGGGAWATASFGFSGVKKGNSEVQLAWYPHEGGVVKTITPGIDEGKAVFMMPLEPLSLPPVATNAPGAWGMRRDSVIGLMESAEAVHARHFEWGRQAVAALGAAAANPKPRQIQFTTSFGAAPAAVATAARMMNDIGINDVGGLPPALLKELDFPQPVELINALDSEYLCLTHDPLDPVAEKNFETALRGHAGRILAGNDATPPLVRIAMGDEISSKGGGPTVNGLESCRRAFHDYLRQNLAAMKTNATYYGVADVAEIPFLDESPAYGGIHANRIYYESLRFKFVLTAMYYAQFTRAAERVFPRVQTYCNFSPHPPMFGQQMNANDWFVLTRHGGANMAWGEDWAGSGGSWSFSGIDVVSYFAAWVECAARAARKLPAGFYAVSSMGSIDRKIFSLLGRGVHWINVYSWGPMYSGAEGSNFWSENPAAYTMAARATHAIGPADDIIANGAMEPRRTGLLYNRAHEIWNGGRDGFQSNRLLLFSALSHAHIPAEILLLDDCTDERLAQYRVLYVQGYNFEQGALQALRRWVEAGGTLIAEAGTAMRDESDTAFGDDEKLFGATQRYVTTSEGNWHPQSLPGHKPVDTAAIMESDLTPALKLEIIGAKFALTPTSGTALGTYGDGSCAAVTRRLGKGRTLLFGFQLGMVYKGAAQGYSRYTLERLPLIAKPAQAALGRQRLECSEPQVEVWLFEHKGEAAITMNKLGPPAAGEERNITISLQTAMKPKEVFSTLQGPLPWERQGERLQIEHPPFETVDVIMLR